MKTLKEFDYDLWATEENGCKRYFARVKATGEETEVSMDVMRLLLSQEKQMRREYAKNSEDGVVLSLDAICTDSEADEAAWLVDPRNSFSKVFATMDVEAFCKMLTPNQAKVFKFCMVEGMAIREYARINGVDHKSVCETAEAIRKKFKKYFF